jgi:nucleotide-binding universal stress UspA family protein
MTTFPATVLLATDGSAHAANARRAAAEISAKSGASLHLVHAWHRRSGPLSLPHDADASRVSSMFERERVLLAEDGAAVAATHAPEGGWPAEQILSVARGIRADLIVVGSRHLNRLQRHLSVPTSEGLLRLTTVPLLVVRDEAGAWPPARLVVGDDGSRAGHDAGVLAVHLGRILDRPVETLEVLDPRVVEAPEPTRVMARVLVGIDQRAAALEEEGSGPRMHGSLRFQRDPASGLEETRATAGAPVLIAVGHRTSRRRVADASPSVASRLLGDGHASLLICPSYALAAIRRRRPVAAPGTGR